MDLLLYRNTVKTWFSTTSAAADFESPCIAQLFQVELLRHRHVWFKFSVSPCQTPKFSMCLGMVVRILVCFLLLLSCSCHRRSAAYEEQYAYLNLRIPKPTTLEKGDYFLVILVDAPHLDYSDCRSFIKTMAKHPRNGSKNRDFGHSWIYLEGWFEGERISIEGGHSGELGIIQAKYFDGVMNYIDFGYPNPTRRQMCCPRYEPNPIKYLWGTLSDGFFQQGPGRHKPSFAAKIDLNEEQFHKIVEFVCTYDYSSYAITGNQCSSFVQKVAAIGNWQIASEQTMCIDQTISINGEKLTLWRDPKYSQITFSSPDVIERSLYESVASGYGTFVDFSDR